MVLYPVVLTRLGGPGSRPYTSRKTYSRRSNPGEICRYVYDVIIAAFLITLTYFINLTTWSWMNLYMTIYRAGFDWNYIWIIMSSAHSPSFQSFHLHHTHSPTLPSLYLHHRSFSNPSVASPTSQLILQPLFCFFYITGFSLTSTGKPPMHHNYPKPYY